MASTYSPNDGFELIGTGDQANVWGASLNNTLNLVDQACDGSVVINLTTPTYALNVADGALSDGRNKVIEFTGTPGSTVAVSVTPVNISKLYWISNQTNQPMTVSNGSGSALVMSSGVCIPCYCDGAGNVTNLLGQPASDTVITNNLVVNTAAALPSGTATTIAGVSLQSYITSLIPAFTAIAGTLVCSAIGAITVTGGAWVTFTLGTTVGTRIKIAIGGGLVTDGGTIILPGGFATDGTNQVINVSIGSFLCTAGQATGLGVAYNPATQVATAPTKSQSGGGSMSVNIAWNGVCWLTGV